ncbi:hypothetical protein [Spirochaeta isovalerica]|uniref:Uncharacterized protein n=1 Tax=Spirochaeta isovalerica TaxID=150 RepID=A0A841RFY9_9SPIO|nr:hypothetical protein [Spirochaeta isovalerica]MBB6481699.1 hypothetical protein [Spirochaeta isovalerica]
MQKCFDEVEKMIAYQKRTIQNAARISPDFKAGYLAALNTLSASIEAEKEISEGNVFFQQIV